MTKTPLKPVKKSLIKKNPIQTKKVAPTLKRINITMANAPEGIESANKIFKKDTIVVLVYSNQCGHCQQMRVDWDSFCKNSIKKQVSSTVEIDLNALSTTTTKNSFLNSVQSKFSGGVPFVVKILPDGEVVHYNGNRTSSDLEKFAKSG